MSANHQTGMSNSVAAIRAQSCECKLDTLLCQLEDAFASYAVLQRSLNDDVTPLVNPSSMIEKVRKMANAVSLLEQEHGQLVADRSLLVEQFGQEASQLDDKIQSTLGYLVAKK